jgi:hypothetical protein
LNGQADDRGRAQTVGDFDIAFDVYSQTNASAASDLVSTPCRKAWGVLYEVPADFIRPKRPDGRQTLVEKALGMRKSRFRYSMKLAKYVRP